jgi:CheY-like chemotaxis protein
MPEIIGQVKKLKVLVVSENENIRYVIKDYYNKHEDLKEKYDLVFEDAYFLNTSSKDIYDFIILDLDKPITYFSEFAAKLRETDKDQAIIWLFRPKENNSTYHDALLEQDKDPSCFTRFIAKDFNHINPDTFSEELFFNMASIVLIKDEFEQLSKYGKIIR